MATGRRAAAGDGRLKVKRRLREEGGEDEDVRVSGGGRGGQVTAESENLTHQTVVGLALEIFEVVAQALDHDAEKSGCTGLLERLVAVPCPPGRMEQLVCLWDDVLLYTRLKPADDDAGSGAEISKRPRE